jgi:hypothetical protein
MPSDLSESLLENPFIFFVVGNDENMEKWEVYSILFHFFIRLGYQPLL